MSDFVYRLMSSFRNRNYRLFRSFVDNPIVYGLLSSLSSRFLTKVEVRPGCSVYLNPVYHSQFTSGLAADYEPEVRRVLECLIEPGQVTYDIGANVGWFTVLMSDRVGPDGAVLAFEPEDVNLQCLARTLKDVTRSNVELVPVCVADRSGQIIFDRRGGAFSGRARIKESDVLSKNYVTKEAVSIDDFVIQHGRPVPDLIKIDVEGNEIGVVKGMQSVLRDYSPVLICEIHHSLEGDFSEMEAVLKNNQYQSFDLSALLKGEAASLNSFEGVSRILALKETGLSSVMKKLSCC